MTDHPHQWYGGQSYAQHGDDYALLNIFHRLGIEKGTYLDIGAHHPFDISNTALLHQRGWRGTCVEPNVDALPLFEEHRPGDLLINACVIGYHFLMETVTFYKEHPLCGLNSTRAKNLHHVSETVQVDVLTPDVVVEMHERAFGGIPDLLSLDAEGEDLGILRDLRAAIPVIIVEAISQHADITKELRVWRVDNGYSLHSWCGSNMIFVKADLMEKLVI
jgi:FkbM family methyltransferase